MQHLCVRRAGTSVALAITITLGLSCRSRRVEQLDSGPTDIRSTNTASASAPSSMVSSASNVAAAHDPANPPIDCPLRKAGINPHALKPFEDVEKYIAFLERSDRALWQKPDELVAALGLKGNEIVADVGAGSGYFSFRLAKALPRGKVIAIDVEPEMIRHIHHKAMTTGMANVQVVLADPSDPKIPNDTGLVFVCDVLHHVKDQPTWLSKMYSETASKTKLVIVEFKEGNLPEGPPATLKIARQRVAELVTAAGFQKLAEDSELLPYQFTLTFIKP